MSNLVIGEDDETEDALLAAHALYDGQLHTVNWHAVAWSDDSVREYTGTLPSRCA